MSADAFKNRIAQNRIRKAARFVAVFDAAVAEAMGVKPTDGARYSAVIAERANVEAVIAQIESATPEQWEQLANDLKENGAPSPETKSVMVIQLRARLPAKCREAECRREAAFGDYLCGEHQVDEIADGHAVERGLIHEGAIR